MEIREGFSEAEQLQKDSARHGSVPGSNLRNGLGVGSNDVCTRVLYVCMLLAGLGVEVSPINLEADLWLCRNFAKKQNSGRSKKFQRLPEQGCVGKAQCCSAVRHLEMEAPLQGSGL